uniref:NADH dehydrogenase subunit 6 n=1 Tax=Helotrephes sp. NKMT027 TaxID=1320099 RepID=C5HIX5_9HEMI|nr:NADH dehydrogenase subunit 6 [Helotrephes sp. NKMT027]ACJ69570.1 NADH dehydrogenase subunit 6 [Helotrephes sp. NKMT027]
MILMLFMMMIISTMFLMCNHPLSMGIILIMNILMATMITGMIINSYMYSYILFIIMLSGMLVLFMYMAAIASNEKFKMNKMMISSFIIMSISALIAVMSIKNIPLIKAEFFSFNSTPQYLDLMKLFEGKTMFITMIMVIYLLVTMILASFIANSFDGPMRKSN